MFFFFFKQKTAYEIWRCDWSSDVCSSDLLAIAPLVVRWFEFSALNIYWDTNAYGSMLWVLLGLHTTHLITDAGDTLVLTTLMFTRHGNSGRRFADVSDNAFYWDFVVLTWIPIYLLIYWLPRGG